MDDGALQPVLLTPRRLARASPMHRRGRRQTVTDALAVGVLPCLFVRPSSSVDEGNIDRKAEA